ncbi:hypothetical protein B7R21_08825 [Subtercola boreus]|uniref:HNH nuclease domain-containing protein n=1 Tax=Subtercola boreus TaxID=120213 RepID=A0A3E0VSF7_9MICO|nr:HNH endonuclease signature motif containing protein [Subtercola boreus]RFA12942.1 hypothetical protein B7R21_08825 [Subtercola boreus]
MNQPAASSFDIASVMHGLVDALQGLGVLPGSGVGAAAPCGLADEDVMAATAEVESFGRIVDGLRVRMAGQVAALSAAEYGDEGLSKSQGFRSVQLFLETVTQASKKAVQDRLRLATRTHTTMSLVGLPNPPQFPRVAEALARGDIGVDVAAVITRRLTDVATRTGFTEQLEEAEGGLVSYAQDRVGGFGYSVREVDDLAIRYREHLDPDGAEPRDADLFERRFLTLTPHCSGMTRVTGMLTGSMAGIIGAALEPFTSPRIVSFQPDPATSNDGDGEGEGGDDGGGVLGDAVTADTRSAGQKRADGLVQLIELGAKDPAVPRLNGAAPTVNLHATLEDVTSGRGVGWIDGLTEPVPYSTVETLLCHGDVITTLFGEHGQVIQHGKTRRLFTTAQNRALAARDGGCVWPGCNAPPSWCESHHVDGWVSPTHPGGLTDLDNGALLCHFHHSNVHKARWKLTIRNGTPHVTPPAKLDWNQTPRPCQQNRARQLPPGHHPPGHEVDDQLRDDHSSDTG